MIMDPPHEVVRRYNNLLAVILGNAELMRLGLPREHPMQQRVRDIAQAAEEAAVLTRRLPTEDEAEMAKPVMG